MKPSLAFALLFACGAGMPHEQVVGTQAATSRPTPAQAPPSSTSDKDRERSTQQFDDMQTTQRAYQEAKKANQPAQNANAPSTQAQPPGTPKKKGVAEQAPPDPAATKKKGVAEQAPPDPATAGKKK